MVSIPLTIVGQSVMIFFASPLGCHGRRDKKGGSLSRRMELRTLDGLGSCSDSTICWPCVARPALESSSDPWFALRVKSNFEHVAAIHLRQRGYQVFSPTYTVAKRWSDRIRNVEKPLFPGYVFSSFDSRFRLPVLTAPGVIHIVGIGKEPIPIDREEIQSIWTMLRSNLPVRPWPFVQVGQKVIVEQGPLTGVIGVVNAFKGIYRIVVGLSMLQRSVSAEIERHWVRPLA